MSVITGVLVALAAAETMWQISTRASTNLSAAMSEAIVVGLLGLGVVVGFLAGSSVCRRAQRSREHLGLFGALAFAVAGGILGASAAVALTAGYLVTYATWPQQPVDSALMALAYPIFGAVGLALGAVCGSACGLLAAGALRILTPTPR